MDYSTGKLSFIFIVAVALSFAAAGWIARRYRASMRSLMSAPVAATATSPLAWAMRAGEMPTPAPVSSNDNRHAGRRLVLLLVALSCLMAFTSAALQLHFSVHAPAVTFKRLLPLALVHLWPVIPALGLMWRWSRWRVLGALLCWCVLCFVVLLWRSIEPRPAELVVYLASEIGAPLVLVALLCLGDATRAIAPWLLPPIIGLVWASIAGIDALGLLVQRRPSWLMALPDWLRPEMTMLLFALLPWLLAWWPLRWLGRWLGRAYAAKQFSELMVLFMAVWGISLLSQALSLASHLGPGGAVMLLPLAWIPLVMALNRRLQRNRERPPTLLVLRVFQHDARVQALFDHVIERWRLTGNTLLMAGTDLVERTLDAGDIFTFLDGQLPARFIRHAGDVARRLAEFDLAPDAEGRYRINECYANDHAWQAALVALVQRSDVVLMDLRGFQARHAGCRYELGVLAQAPRIARVVVLTDGQTDQPAALAAAAGAPPGRFVWLDAAHVGRAERRKVLDHLFVAAPHGEPRTTGAALR